MDCGKLKAYRLTTKKNGGIRFSLEQIERMLAESETKGGVSAAPPPPLKHITLPSS